MKRFTILILSSLLISNYSFAGGSETGGPGFVFPAEVRNQENCLFEECDMIHQAALEVSEGKEYFAGELAYTHRAQVNNLMQIIINYSNDTSPGGIKNVILQSVRATILNNLGGYDQEEAINAVIDSPEESKSEVREIVISI